MRQTELMDPFFSFYRSLDSRSVSISPIQPTSKSTRGIESLDSVTCPTIPLLLRLRYGIRLETLG